jgi:hypothetical protein
MRGVHDLIRQSHLPLHMNKNGISVIIFWRISDFAGAVAPNIPQPFSA